jgi:hypothetical protein
LGVVSGIDAGYGALEKPVDQEGRAIGLHRCTASAAKVALARSDKWRWAS